MRFDCLLAAQLAGVSTGSAGAEESAQHSALSIQPRTKTLPPMNTDYTDRKKPTPLKHGGTEEAE
jgi:hypothetical protein